MNPKKYHVSNVLFSVNQLDITKYPVYVIFTKQSEIMK